MHKKQRKQNDSKSHTHDLITENNRGFAVACKEILVDFGVLYYAGLT